jgi:hypothetical protein
MMNVPGYVCAICGEPKEAGQFWFLVAESPWRDKLQILSWHDEAAERRGIYPICCSSHVREMVVQWMTDELILASRPDPTASNNLRHVVAGIWAEEEADTRGTREIAELRIDREAVNRALDNNPDSLRILLDELGDVLQREADGIPARLESVDSISCLRQM